MRYFFAIILGINLLALSSCKKDEKVYPIISTTPGDFRLYAKPGDIVSVTISVSSDIALKQFVIKSQIQNQFQIVEIDTNIFSKTFTYLLQYKVPETAAGKLIYFVYQAYDDEGNEGKQVQQILVADEALKETTGHEFHSGLHFTNNAFDLETLTPVTASLVDSTFRDLQEYILDSNTQSLSYQWRSPARSKFVKANNFNYAQATFNAAESQYNISVPTDVTDSLVVNDIYIIKLGSMQSSKFAVVKITDLVEQPGTDKDVYIFSVKK